MLKHPPKSTSTEFTICVIRNSGYISISKDQHLEKKKKILCCQAINSYGNECELGKQEKNWFRAIIGLQVMPAISGNHKSQLRWNNKVGWRWALWKDLKSNHHSESDPEQEGRGLLEQLTGPSDQWQHQRWRIHFGCFTYLYYII